MPDQIIREIPLIERYARNNEAQDFKFRTFLKVGLDLSNEKLDAVVQETTDAIWKQINCTTCAHCCSTLQVVVDKQDILRLAKRLRTTPKQFSQKYIRVDEGTSVFATQPCPFLGEDKRCTVYEDRPQACQDYPYLHKDGFRSRSLMIIESTAVCPIVFNVWQDLKKRLWRRRK